MDAVIPVLLFPVFFVALWVGVTWLLGWMSGWFALMERYPDKPEKPSLQLTWQTGAMGAGVNYKNILKLGVCRDGLRVGVPKFFGVFARDFLVPWREIKVKRSRWFWTDVAELSFGDTGRLVVTAATADRLAAAAAKDWPEKPARR